MPSRYAALRGEDTMFRQHDGLEDDFRYAGAPRPLRAHDKAPALGPYTGGTTLAATRGKMRPVRLGVLPKPPTEHEGKGRQTKPKGRSARRKDKRNEKGGKR